MQGERQIKFTIGEDVFKVKIWLKWAAEDSVGGLVKAGKSILIDAAVIGVVVAFQSHISGQLHLGGLAQGCFIKFACKSSS